VLRHLAAIPVPAFIAVINEIVRSALRSTSPRWRDEAEAKGVDFILSKPFDYTKVLREVNAALKSKKR